MEMEAGDSLTMLSVTQERDLQGLLEVFGPMFSLEDIASAYHRARYDVVAAGDILCTSRVSDSASDDTFDGVGEMSNVLSPLGVNILSYKKSTEDESRKSLQGRRETKTAKSNMFPAPVGTVSSIIGKECIQPKSATNEHLQATKPLKLNSAVLPASEIWPEEASPGVPTKGPMQGEVMEFLFQMLGHGFQLEKNVIQEVLGSCGYDVQKTMEKIFDLSASTLEKCDDILVSSGGDPTEKHPTVNSALSEGTEITASNSTESYEEQKDRFSLQKEILEALFVVPERSDEAPKQTKLVRERRSVPYGEPVFEPPRDTTSEQKSRAGEPEKVINDEDENKDDSYEVLRRAMKEYWITMKEYYKASVDAFTKGDHARADKLLQQGHFFNMKARETDEKIAQKLQGTRDMVDEVSLDLHEFQPKEALRILRSHLTSLSGNPALKYLQMVVGTDEEDTTKGARKKLIIKQLEKEAIKWTEEESGRIMRIQLDVIDPKCLSFAKKRE